MPYIGEHAVRLRDPARYERFRRENDKFGVGIDAIWGITEDGTVELQGLRFDAKRYHLDFVQNWLAEHNLHALLIEPAIQRDENSDGSGFVERVARLFRAGQYRSKGVEIDEHTLDTIIQNSADVPVVIEHKPDFIRLGYIAEMWRKGKELWGRLVLKKSANDVIEENDARSLSVSLDLSEDTPKLVEVSVVKSPFIPDAQLFQASNDTDTNLANEPTEKFADASVLDWTEVAMEDRFNDVIKQFESAISERDARIAALEHELRLTKVREQVRQYAESGHLAPAQFELAEAILLALHQNNATVQFNNAQTDLLALFDQFVKSNPKLPEPETKLARSTPASTLEQELKRMGVPESGIRALMEVNNNA